MLSIHRKLASLLVILALFNSSVLAVTALFDICCDPAERAASTHVLADGSGTDSDSMHIPHCCHASVHYSALVYTGDTEQPLSHIIWPVTAVTHRAFLTHAPPVPPPNA